MSIQYINFYELKKPYGWASNFYNGNPIKIDGKLWKTSEAYFQAQKFIYDGAPKRSIEYGELIRLADTQMKVKILGTQKKYYRANKWQLVLHKDKRIINDLVDEYSNVKLRKDWESVKISVMIKALIFKFQDDVLRKKLKSIPDNAIMVEHTKRDRIWGDGGDGSGTNYLGKILTVLSWILKYGSCKNMPKNIKKLVRIK
tara:strand:- start:189 stop:788 length:600 start_codon:yes stop_codon:yes gene_type:complete